MVPEKITIDKSGANTAAIEDYNTERGTNIEIRLVKYLNSIIKQDHRSHQATGATNAGIQNLLVSCVPQANCAKRSSSIRWRAESIPSSWIPTRSLRKFATEPESAITTRAQAGRRATLHPNLQPPLGPRLNGGPRDDRSGIRLGAVEAGRPPRPQAD